MSIKEKIKRDLITALKNQEKLAVSALRMVESAIKNKEIEKRTRLSKTIQDAQELEKQSALNDAEILEVLISESKKRKEAIEEYKKGGRSDLAENEASELNVIKKYLPEQMSAEKIGEEIKKIIAEIKPSGPQDFGKVMGLAASKLKGRADGKLISEIVKKSLQP